MAEDRRIIKTKRSLKQALCTLLAEKPFEQLTVKDICAQSSISRITFYTHYTDKFDLLGDLFLDFSEAAIARFQAFQAENNPKKDAYVSCRNLLDSLLDLYFDATGALSDPLTEESPHLYFALSKCILDSAERVMIAEKIPVNPHFGMRKTVWFFCYGLLGLINEARAEGGEMDGIREEARGILSALMHTELFALDQSESES